MRATLPPQVRSEISETLHNITPQLREVCAKFPEIEPLLQAIWLHGYGEGFGAAIDGRTDLIDKVAEQSPEDTL